MTATPRASTSGSAALVTVRTRQLGKSWRMPRLGPLVELPGAHVWPRHRFELLVAEASPRPALEPSPVV